MENLFTELLDRKVRLVLYLVVFLLLLGFGAWQAASGNVLEAVVGFLSSLAPLLAGSNLSPPPVDPQKLLAGAPVDQLLAELQARGPSGQPTSNLSAEHASWSDPDQGR